MNDIITDITNNEYKWGFETEVATEFAAKGLNEDTIRFISARKNEPEWLLEFRLKAYRLWLEKIEPHWAQIKYPVIDYQDIIYWAAPKPSTSPQTETGNIEEDLKETFSKLGVPLDETEAMCSTDNCVAYDAVMDSVSVKTTFKDELAKYGIIFSSISEAVHEHSELIKKYLGSVVPSNDNFFAALNSAVFSDGSFVYIPKGVRCPMDLSTYFRINAKNTGQFERTLIIADEGSYVSYMEGCTAPIRDENQLHAAIVEIVVMKDAEVKYSTVQNWYPGDKNGKGGIYNFVTKRGICKGARSKLPGRKLKQAVQ